MSAMIRLSTIRLLCLLLFGYLLCGCTGIPHSESDRPFVKTDTGSVVGKYVKVFDSDVAAFLGVPYAIPPLGEKRFLKADPIDHWEGILQATEKTQPCMQFSSRNFGWIPTTKPSENCLYLNIWMPKKNSSVTIEKLPVLVWIFGGGYSSGSTDLDVYDGSIIASYEEVVVVSINYRVSVFGFLNTGNDEIPGNVGLYDQNLGLKWIKRNIQYFGGDPESITLFGESVGAIAIGLHMLSPLSRGLFHRVILQSGSAYNPYLFVDTNTGSLSKANAFVQYVGCSNDSVKLPKDSDVVVECLKQKPSMELAKAEDVFASPTPIYFEPFSKSEFLPKSPIEAFESGDFAPVEVLIGILSNEAAILMNYAFSDVFKLDEEPVLTGILAKQIIPDFFPMFPQSMIDKIFSFYFQGIVDTDSPANLEAFENSYSDFTFNCRSMFLAEKTNNTYMYWMSHRSPKDPNAHWLGATHFSDVPYIFGKPIMDTKNFTPEDGQFSRDLIQKWTSFARNGYPLEDDSREAWPRFTSSNPVVYELNPRHTNNITFPRREACEFWRPIFASSSVV